MDTLLHFSAPTLLLGAATFYLQRKGKNALLTFIPMMFTLGMTLWGLAVGMHAFVLRG